jgi:hypothetical protein
MVKLRYLEGPNICECGERQSDGHLIKCALVIPGCTIDDLALSNRNSISIVTYWLKQNI